MKVFLHDMSWIEFSERKENSTIILPIGSTEQHGPMLPLGVDSILSTGLAERIGKEINGIVAPTITYGYKSAPLSGGGPLFPGTIDLKGRTFISLVEDVLEEFAKDGVKNIFIMNGHYENEPFVVEAMDNISEKYPEVTIIETSWWHLVSQKTLDIVFDEVSFPGWALEHAAIVETSMTMAFKAELVDMSKFVEDGVDEELPYVIYPTSKCKVPKTGLLATARTASKEKGDLIIDEVVKGCIEIINKNC